MISITRGGSPATGSPNVVLIYMDDMVHWALTDPQCQTPNLDRLAARGTVVSHAFNQGSTQEAVCTPARQMLLTGLSLFSADREFMSAPRLGRIFREAGYQTFFTGKWHNEEEALLADYDVVGPWSAALDHSPNHSGDDYHRPAPGNTWDPADTTRGGHWMTNANGEVQHSSELWTDSALALLDSRDPQSPFLLHLALHAPHDPRQAPQPFLDLYPASSVRVPPNAYAEHPFDNGHLDARDEFLAPFPRTPEAVQLHRSEYFAILTHADEQIGRVLDRLEADGLLDSTIVVFSGDHGLALGEHGLMGKQNLYDHSIRVPLVFAGPGVPEGRRLDELVYSGSILATVCELTGVTAPEGIEFASLVPAMRGEPHETVEALFGAYRDDQRMVRTTRHKLVHYPRIGRNQVFDLAEDPWETEDLSDRTDLVERLGTELRRLQERFGDPTASSTRTTRPTTTQASSPNTKE